MKGDPAKAPPPGYVRALRFQFLTRFYDPLIRWAMPEEDLRRQLVEQAVIEAHHSVLDLGCGTGTLALRIQQAHPSTAVTGLDGDAEILALARGKAEADGVSIDYRLGLAGDPPFADGSFDRIVSSLMFHHLTTAEKTRSLARCRLLLRPGGQLHVADWGRPANLPMRLAFLSVRLLDGFETTADSAGGHFPRLMREAGFADVREEGSRLTVFGTLRFFRGSREA